MWLLPIFNLDKVLNSMDKLKEVHMNYYENKNGIDIREWLMNENPKAWAVISMFNALKYHVRAGRKEGEAEEKDLKKKKDYLKDYAKVTEQTYSGAVRDLHDNAIEFYDYDN